MLRLRVLLLTLVAGIVVVNCTLTKTFCGNFNITSDALIIEMKKIPIEFTGKLFRCTSRTTAPSDQTLMIQYLHYDIPCRFGNMKIYDPSGSDYPTRTLCGPLSNSAQYSTLTRSVKQVFTRTSSSTSMIGRGFRILITRVYGFSHYGLSGGDDLPDIPNKLPYTIPYLDGLYQDREPITKPAGLRNRVPLNNEFRCYNGYIIGLSLKCDGYNNCGDNSDESEQACRSTTQTTRSVPLMKRFRCNNGRSISSLLKCNRHNDCSDGSDESERTCHWTTKHYTQTTRRVPLVKRFRCDNGHIISLLFMCNRHNDCSDGSDESERTCHWTTKRYTPLQETTASYKVESYDVDYSLHTSSLSQSQIGAIAGSMSGVFIMVVVVVILRIRCRRQSTVIQTSHPGSNVTTISTVQNETPAGQARPQSPTRAPYPPSQYDNGYSYN